LRIAQRIVKVKRIEVETPTIKTLFFDSDISAEPGQFVMIWIPGIDEVPMSLSYTGKEKGITIKNIGEATNALCSMKDGDSFGIRGPYGNPFVLQQGTILAVGGGSGIATLAPAIELFSDKGASVETCIGAVTKDELIFRKRLERIAKVQIATDDGSDGYKGFVTGLVNDIIDDVKPNQMITCGPEPMMKLLLDLSVKKGIGFQAALERYMKCGIGICDSCSLGPYLVCKDGPVLGSDRLITVKDFGMFKRSPSGGRTRI
jgi:dihydroorotate dehydrogenase electron transfer subunit